jgi:hypothetical protein
VRVEVPGCTTTEATYEDDIKPIDADTTHDPITLVGAPANEPVAFAIVSKVKYDDALGLVKVNVFNPDRSSPIDPLLSCVGVYDAIIC